MLQKRAIASERPLFRKRAGIYRSRSGAPFQSRHATLVPRGSRPIEYLRHSITRRGLPVVRENGWVGATTLPSLIDGLYSVDPNRRGRGHRACEDDAVLVTGGPTIQLRGCGLVGPFVQYSPISPSNTPHAVFCYLIVAINVFRRRKSHVVKGLCGRYSGVVNVHACGYSAIRELKA